MRIVSGQWKGRKILVPDTHDTRPTMDRTREAIFNILRSAVWALKPNGEPILYDAKVLDVFAGSGALGFEALSQGAHDVTFFELSKTAIPVIQRNIAALNAKATIVQGSVVRLPSHTGLVADIAFLDPPYEQDLVSTALAELKQKRWIDENTLLVIETRKTEEVANVTVLDTRLYGLAKVTFARLAD